MPRTYKTTRITTVETDANNPRPSTTRKSPRRTRREARTAGSVNFYRDEAA